MVSVVPEVQVDFAKVQKYLRTYLVLQRYMKSYIDMSVSM